jgi:hypothetical protein
VDLDSRLWIVIDKKTKWWWKIEEKKKVENEILKSDFSTLNLLHKACTRTKQKFNSREGCGNWKFLSEI